MKKVFIISGSALFVLLLFLGIYNFSFKKNNAAPAETSSEIKDVQSTQDIRKNQDAKILPVSTEGVMGLFVDKNNKQLLYYSKVNGNVWQMDDEGKNPVIISDTVLKGIQNAQWSPDRTMALTQFDQDGKKIFYEYSYITKTGKQLKDGIDVIAWDGLGKKILYKYYDNATKKRSLNIADPDGSNWQTLVADLPTRDVSIAQIPLSSLVSFWNYPNSNEETKLQIVGMTGNGQKVIFSGKYGADYLWSPDGSFALVSSLQDLTSNKLTLGLIDSYGGNYKDLGISTLASKCAWSLDSRTVYCAVPTNIPTGAIMPDDYMTKKIYSSDSFVKINTQSVKKETIAQSQAIEYDASNLKLSSNEGTLLFVNRKDDKLYKLSL